MGQHMRKTLAIGLLSVGVILTGYYGVRAVQTYIMMQKVESSVENPVALKRWMTIPYLSKTHSVPKEYLYKAIEVSPEGNDDRSLRYIKKNYYEGEIEIMLITLQKAIANYKAGNN